MACWVSSPHAHVPVSLNSYNNFKLSRSFTNFSFIKQQNHSSWVLKNRFYSHHSRVSCTSSNDYSDKQADPKGIQLYRDIERVLTESVRQSQGGSSGDWSEIEGAWVLRPRNIEPVSVVHFIGGIFVGAAPQLTYRLFLECLAEKGILVIATPYASGFDYFYITDEVQLKYDRCLRSLQDTVQDLPKFGIGHSLGSLIHLLIGSRYAVERSGNVLMAFNNKEASVAVPLFSPVLLPMAQSIGPLLSQIASSPTIRRGAELTIKQLEVTMKQMENLSPPMMKQVLPLVEQLPPLYMDLVNGRENFTPRPEESRRLIKSYYGISRNLLIKFKDDTIDETPILAQLLSSESAISSMLDMSIRMLPGDHALPLQQGLPDVPPAMADAVNQGGKMLADLTVGTPWESMAKQISFVTLRNKSPLLLSDDPGEINTRLFLFQRLNLSARDNKINFSLIINCLAGNPLV
ncbi:hypothetical protein LIER_05132 [Lithospermum erythrorhizon]|uniref:Uncharacterized protein n=1 Tax=Lithospermum erythrorhizon TaxID=34254 RepID=A0AAV3NZD3_LITER